MDVLKPVTPVLPLLSFVLFYDSSKRKADIEYFSKILYPNVKVKECFGFMSKRCDIPKTMHLGKKPVDVPQKSFSPPLFTNHLY